AGRCAIFTISSAKAAPARFTTDSIASDRRPTEPVSRQARVLRTMVSTATAIDQRRSTWGARRCAAIARDMARLCGTAHARMPSMRLPRSSRAALALWLLLTAVGCVTLARLELAHQQELFETDARIAHRLLSQRVVQH